MNTIYEFPPILSGSAEQRVAQLRDYLVRLVQTLPDEAQLAQPAAETAAGPSGTAGGAGPSPAGADAASVEALRLKALIVKTADVIEREIGALGDTYLARSDFGEYRETVDTDVRRTAREIVESYDFRSQITAQGEELARYRTKIDGEIRRGFLPDPDRAGEYVFGIAVAQRIVTDGTVRVNAADGLEYEGLDLNAMSALGLYTSTGWQFWLNGQKAGWFDATDGMLHVPNVVMESSALFGDDWLVTVGGGWGLRYTGA